MYLWTCLEFKEDHLLMLLKKKKRICIISFGGKAQNLHHSDKFKELSCTAAMPTCHSELIFAFNKYIFPNDNQ